MQLVEFKNVYKRYPNGVSALCDVNLEISKGEFQHRMFKLVILIIVDSLYSSIYPIVLLNSSRKRGRLSSSFLRYEKLLIINQILISNLMKKYCKQQKEVY